MNTDNNNVFIAYPSDYAIFYTTDYKRPRRMSYKNKHFSGTRLGIQLKNTEPFQIRYVIIIFPFFSKYTERGQTIWIFHLLQFKHQQFCVH